MASPQRGVAYDFSLSLVDVANPTTFKVDPTIAAGDFQVSIDDGAFNNLATLPSVLPAGSERVKVSLSASEMDGDKITVRAKDVADDEWVMVVVSLEESVADIADGVWESFIAEHTQMGTFGGELATKADIVAAASTIVRVVESGTIVEGSEVSGTPASTVIRNGTYWQIQEDGSTGITVEFTFLMTTKTCRPGIFEVFGRYEGVPASVHYQELWAWNVESAAFEQLTETFMPGGNTSDVAHLHEYFERHINRTTDEVKIRIVHNVTSYNSAHNIYLDHVTLSCIEVITAADIADAVWDEPIADHSGVSDSAAEHVDRLDADITSRESESDADTRQAVLIAEHNSTQVDIAALPTANENAGAVWESVLEGSLEAQEIMRILLSVLSGTSTVTFPSKGITRTTYKSLDGGTSRAIVDHDKKGFRSISIVNGA